MHGFTGTGLKGCHADHVVEDAQQLAVVLFYKVYEVLALFRIVDHREYVAEANNGIEGRAYLVRDVGKEGRLQAVALLGMEERVVKVLFGLLLLVDASYGTYDAEGTSLDVTFVDGGIQLAPIGATAIRHVHLILQVGHILTTMYKVVHCCAYLIRGICMDTCEDVGKRCAGGCRKTVGSITIVAFKSNGICGDIYTEDCQTHGFQYQVVLYGVQLHLVEQLEVVRELAVPAILHDEHHHGKKQDGQTDEPRQIVGLQQRTQGEEGQLESVSHIAG